MGILKKILIFLKDLVTGSLYPGLAAGFTLLVAAAMFYIQPLDYFSDKALFPQNPQRPEVQLAWKLLKLGGEIAAGCAVALWLIMGIEAWWKKRPKKEPAAETPKEAA